METIWFLLWGILWAAYFMLDGFDLGVGILFPFLGKKESDRKKMAKAIGPFWDGNEVWLVTAGGVTFAAFPGAYATMFSALYSPLMLILFALILRGAGLAMREEMESKPQRAFWDRMFFAGSFVAALLFGVTFANLFQGIPIDAEGVFQGNLFTLLNPYGLVGGLMFLTFFILHGAVWLAFKTEDELHDNAMKMLPKLWVVLAILAVGFLGMTAILTDLYLNYLKTPVLFVLPVVTVICLLLSGVFIRKTEWKKAWFAGSGFIFFATLFGVVGMYPGMVISSLDPSFSRTIANSVSSPKTLLIMLVVTLIFIPLVAIYQAWAYKIFGGKVSSDHEGY